MRRRGYTLIETLIALIIFALVSAATGFALSAAIRGQDAVQKRADEMQEARAVLSTLSKDIRAAYASAGNTNTFFVASGAETGVILTFTTLNHRIDLGQTVTAGAADNTVTMPQSDVAVQLSPLGIVRILDDRNIRLGHRYRIVRSRAERAGPL